MGTTRRGERGAALRAPRVQFALALAAVGAIGVVLPVVVARRYGALGVPRGDDWSYLRTLFRWVDSGELNFNNWVSMALLGQLLLAAPVAMWRGRDVASAQLVTAVLAFGAMWGVLATGTALFRRVWIAAFVTIAVAAAPFWAILATSFMTDVPAFACVMITIALGARALRGSETSFPLVVAAGCVGMFGFTVREYAVFPLIALVVLAAVRFGDEGRRREQLTTLALAGLAVVGAVAFLAYWRTIPAGKPFSPTFPDRHAVSVLAYKGAGMVRLLGLVLVPVLLIARPVALLRRSWSACAGLVVALVAVTAAWLTATGIAAPRIAFAGNYVTPIGALGDGVSTGRRPELIPGPLFDTLIVLGTVAAIFLAAIAAAPLHELWTRLRARRFAPEGSPAMFVAGTAALYAGGYTLAALAGLPLYDRYVLPLIALVGLLVANAGLRIAGATESAIRTPSGAGAWARRGALVALAVSLLLGTVYAADSASFDGARWHVAADAVRAGWAPRQIGGSFEWVNFHSLRPGTLARQRGRVRFCVVVRVAPDPARLDRRRVVAVRTYRRPLQDDVRVVASRTNRLCLPRLRLATP